MLLLLLSQAGLQPSHLVFKLGDGVFLVHIHRLEHLQLGAQLCVFQLSVFKVNLVHTYTDHFLKT